MKKNKEQDETCKEDTQLKKSGLILFCKRGLQTRELLLISD